MENEHEEEARGWVFRYSGLRHGMSFDESDMQKAYLAGKCAGLEEAWDAVEEENTTA